MYRTLSIYRDETKDYLVSTVYLLDGSYETMVFRNGVGKRNRLDIWCRRARNLIEAQANHNNALCLYGPKKEQAND